MNYTEFKKLILEAKLSKRVYGFLACTFAETVLHLMTDSRSKDAIKVTKLYLDGLVSESVFLEARNAAADAAAYAAASAAAYAIYAAADAAASAAAYARNAAADAAAYIAFVVASAAAYAADVDYKNFKKILDYFIGPRTKIMVPKHIIGLAQTIYDNEDWFLMPILADALEEIGQARMSEQCRLENHYKGGWVLDSILGKQ